jgi:predicted hotdog family 3-hydroxylacyl-ACP dehydratase
VLSVDIAALVPQGGAMVLLDAVESWDSGAIVCRARSHLDPENPLRRDGMLPAVAGIEYGLQAAALHGGLCAGAAPRPGFLASLRDVRLAIARLDDPAFGALRVSAVLHLREDAGQIYSFEVRAAHGPILLTGRAVIALPA